MIAAVLFVGGAWVVVDRLGTLPAVVAALVRGFRHRGLWAIPVVGVFFATMGALENMQEEIIPLVPVLLVLGRGLGVDAVVVVAILRHLLPATASSIAARCSVVAFLLPAPWARASRPR